MCISILHNLIFKRFYVCSENEKYPNYFHLLFRQRVPGKNVFYYKCPDHRKNYVMSFAFQFDREDDVYEVKSTFALREIPLCDFYIINLEVYDFLYQSNKLII